MTAYANAYKGYQIESYDDGSARVFRPPAARLAHVVPDSACDSIDEAKDLIDGLTKHDEQAIGEIERIITSGDSPARKLDRIDAVIVAHGFWGKR